MSAAEGQPINRPRCGEGEEVRSSKVPLVAGARPFLVERFFARHEFTAEFMLGSSDAEAWTARSLLELARARGDEKAATEWAEVNLGYTESSGHPELRAAIAGLYGNNIEADQVLCVVPEEGIFMTMSTLLSPGDVVVAMMPAYQSLYELARAKGCTVRKWEGTYTKGIGFSFSIDGLRKALDGEETVRMVVTNFPHNPTSWMPTPAEHAELISICRQRQLLLFSDEMYWGMALEHGEPESSCSRYEHAITLSGLSKPYGLPGLRVGWIATRDTDVMAKLRQMKDYVTICGSAPSEVLAIIALRHGRALLERAWETTRKNRELFKAFCAQFPELFEYAPEPSAGLTLFVVLRGWAAQMGAQAFADWCVEAASCVLVPSDCFEAPEPPAVRIGLGRANFPEALERLRSCLLKTKDGPKGS